MICDSNCNGNSNGNSNSNSDGNSNSNSNCYATQGARPHGPGDDEVRRPFMYVYIYIYIYICHGIVLYCIVSSIRIIWYDIVMEM